MKLLFRIVCLILFSMHYAFPQSAPILLDSLGTDKASAYSMGTKIVSCDIGGTRKTHIAYSRIDPSKPFEPWETMSVYVATYNHRSDSIENRTFLGTIFDNHGTPCLAVDSQGYLHIVYGPHHHPFIYQRSKYPNNSSEWLTKEIVSFEYGQIDLENPYWRSETFIEKEGKSEWTYPIIKIDANDRIHVAGSLGHSAAYVRKINGVWEKPRVIYKAERQLCRYNVMMNLDAQGNVYILAPEVDLLTNDEGYTQFNTEYVLFHSNNSGDSFENQGTVISGHVQGTGNLSIDAGGNVHFLCFERNYKIHRYLYHVFSDGQTWIKQRIYIQDYFFWDASLTIDDTDNALIFCAANQSDFHWRDATNELFLIRSEPGNSSDYNFTYNKIVSKYQGRNRWLPSLEANQIHTAFNSDSFFLMWTDEIDLKGKYTTHKNSNLTTRIFIKNIFSEKD